MCTYVGDAHEGGILVDPDLSGSAGTPPVLPPLLSPEGLGVGAPGTKNPMSVVAEGLPPIPTKLLEKIRRWEYVDLTLLLHDSKSEELAGYQPSNQVLVIQSVEQIQRKKKTISDLQTWIQAFSVFAAVLGSAPTTSQEETVGLWAHLHLIVQLHKDLGTRQSIKYDQDFREWAAAKGVRTWGDLNLPIYGRCLSVQQKAVTSVPSLAPPFVRPRRDKREYSSPGDSHTRRGACFKWNFERTCPRVDCRYTHECYRCGEDHMVLDCPKPATKRGPLR